MGLKAREEINVYVFAIRQNASVVYKSCRQTCSPVSAWSPCVCVCLGGQPCVWSLNVWSVVKHRVPAWYRSPADRRGGDWTLDVPQAAETSSTPSAQTYTHSQTDRHTARDTDTWTYRMGQKTCHLTFVHLLADCQNFFTNAFCGQLAIKWLLNIPPHSNSVASLPCEI